QLAIDSRPLPQNASQVVPLYIDAAASGSYSLALKQLANLPGVYQVVLRDNYMQDSVIMHEGTSYSFSIDKSNAATFGGSRFQLVISTAAQNTLRLTSFSGSKTQSGSLLNWNVSNEFNTTTFYVERSTDKGKTFLPAGSLQSNNSGSYSLVDKNPVTGENQYRLKMIDFNKNITYSNVVSLIYTSTLSNSANISIYPNPTTSAINLSIAQDNKLGNFKTDPYDIKIVSSFGVVVKQSSSQEATWQANIADLQPGTYMVHVTNHNNKSLIGTASFVKD
ncbi:MAG TPA: T9SS type A sorting domain-containing protein, partial [Mucilaginibacter sp.]|nr:T9SS type A sorting domain-containing protein [Mucilaginibacter sp.]